MAELKTSIGIWAFGTLGTRFLLAGYHPQVVNEDPVDRAKRVSAGLADLYDTGADFQLTRTLALGLYFGYAKGGPVIHKIFSTGADAKMGYIEANYSF